MKPIYAGAETRASSEIFDFSQGPEEEKTFTGARTRFPHWQELNVVHSISYQKLRLAGLIVPFHLFLSLETISVWGALKTNKTRKKWSPSFAKQPVIWNYSHDRPFKSLLKSSSNGSIPAQGVCSPRKTTRVGSKKNCSVSKVEHFFCRSLGRLC